MNSTESTVEPRPPSVLQWENILKTLMVELGQRSYPITLGKGLLSRPETFATAIRGRQVMVVTNETVAPLYLEPLRSALAGYRVDTTILEDGEAFKTLKSFDVIMDHLLTQHHGRGTTLVALGGGVIGDLTGFAAACYQRGVDFVQVPTTLLAMVDSSVGGKTGVNHRLGKNMIGAFHQPRAVIIDTGTLSTLPAREFAAGLAEVIKYGLICDAAFLSFVESTLEAIVGLDPVALSVVIETSCRCKARFVAVDETEQGERALLNLGHTFGHAIEAFSGYRDWLHGEAVAVGLLMAADLSMRLGWIDADFVERLARLLSRADLPVRPPVAMKPEDFITYMAVDKKVVDGVIRLVLPTATGQARVTADYPPHLLQETLQTFATH